MELKPTTRRPKIMPAQATNTITVARTTGGCASVVAAYSTLARATISNAGRSGIKPARIARNKQPARMPTFSPEITSKWIVPVSMNACVRSGSSSSREPRNMADARPESFGRRFRHKRASPPERSASIARARLHAAPRDSVLTHSGNSAESEHNLRSARA